MRGHSQTVRTKGSTAGQATLHEPQSEKPLKHIDEPLRLVHHHPGYLRIRADAFLQAGEDDPIVAAARTAADTVPGFRSWSHNPKTGSVVVQYEPGTIEPDDLLKHIAKCGGFQGVEIATRIKINRQEFVSGILDTFQDINRVVDQLTGGRADLRELTPAALAAASVISFLLNENRGRFPEWSGLLYHSYRVFMHWHRPEVRRRERIGRQVEERAGAADRIVDQAG